MYLPFWNGKPAALDFAITSPHQARSPPDALHNSGATARAYECFKRSHLRTAEDCEAQGMAFLPMVAEPSGGWGPSAVCTFKAMAKVQATCSDRDHQSILASELCQLSTVLRRANARAVLSRGVDITSPGTTAQANASAILHASED